MIKEKFLMDTAEFKSKVVRWITAYGDSLADADGNLGLNAQMLQRLHWSISRQAGCRDNAMTEQFFGSVVGEQTALLYDAVR
jgi:hypothetical protein